DTSVTTCGNGVIISCISREENASENSEPVQFWKADKKSIHQIDDGSSNRSFTFDRVFTADETTHQLYQTIAKPLVVSTVGGYNGTIFAYGQTSSGKTFTMMGGDHNPGVIPLAVEEVFQSIKNFPNKEFLLRVSYMEIYNETVTDLLVDSWKRKPLEVRESINKNICVADLTEELVTTCAQALAWVRKGEKNRHYAKTKMNQRSSRSHAIFRMILESRERSDPASSDTADGAIIVSHLNLVDLAGSERASQTGAEGARFKEGCNINRSLFMLGQVMKKLTDESQKGFINYRDSKLTRILQNSLGGNAKTVIICTITPATLEETLGTLQFASTAKKMKNDPHVTEVSDDGALLKRYRNEIVELKQRLQEVSSVSQTTVTEKEALSQLLQEKDQLQREQEDRIKNLTKLLVTSSNQVFVQKVPKRRITWGGKMVKLAGKAPFDDHHDDDDGDLPDMSFAGPFGRRTKMPVSSLTELSEAEYFDSQWGTPEEPFDETEMNESSVTARSHRDSFRDWVSPSQSRELSEKVSQLELQLEVEVQQKEEAMKRANLLDDRLAELQLQLQSEALQKREAAEKMESAGQKLADLERQLQEQSQADAKQMVREFAETIQLCETLATEKDQIIAERDYLKQELGMFMEQTQHLEKEKAALSQELKEINDLDEFESLEERINKDLETELRSEICSLKEAVKSSEAQRLELQNKLQALSEELNKKTEFAEELQKMSGKDLVQEVATLRRSLDDAEGVSRDTKKEWAFLRSENMSLEELNGTLTAKQEKMESEMNDLLLQLKTEKSRYKKMQSDLQKELNIAFDENTKLSTLLDGNVPKSLTDGLELERTVTRLEKELTASREAGETLRAELQTLASFKTLPDQVENLTKQVCDLTEELQCVKTERDDLLSGQTRSDLEARQFSEENPKIQADLGVSAQEEELRPQLDSLRPAQERSEEEKSRLVAFLQERDLEIKQLRETLEWEHAEKEVLLSELRGSAQSSADESEKLNSTITSVSAERDQLRMQLQTLVDKATETDVLLQSLQQELKEQKQKIFDLMRTSEQKECELQEHISKLSQELQGTRDENRALQESAAEEAEKLLSAVAALTAERDELKNDLRGNIDMVTSAKTPIQGALGGWQPHHYLGTTLGAPQPLPPTTGPEAEGSPEEMLEGLKYVTCIITQAKMDDVSKTSNAINSNQLKAKLKRRSLAATASQIRPVQKTRIRVHGPQRVNAHVLFAQMQCDFLQQQQLTSEPQLLMEIQENHQLQMDQLEKMLENAKEETSRLKFDLQDKVKLIAEKQENLDVSEEKSRVLQEELAALKLQTEVLESRKNEAEGTVQSLKSRVQVLTAEVESVGVERDNLLSEKESISRSHLEEMEKLRLSLSEENNQLREELEGLREEKQLREELEDRAEMLQAEVHKNQDQRKKIKLLESEKARNEPPPDFNSQLEELQGKIKTLTEELEPVLAERDALMLEKESNRQTEEMEKLLSRVSSLSQERDQLQEALEGQREEKKRLREELEDRIQTSQSFMVLFPMTNELFQFFSRACWRQTVQLICADSASYCSHCLTTPPSPVRHFSQNLLVATGPGGFSSSLSLLLEGWLTPMQTSQQTFKEELQEALSRVSSLGEERARLQEALEGSREEKRQLGEELEDRTRMMSAVQEKLSQQEEWSLQLQERDAELKREVQHLEEELQTQTEQQARAKAEADASQLMLTEAKATISTLKQRLDGLEQNAEGVEVISSQLQDSSSQLQECFGRFQELKDTISKYKSPDKALRRQRSLMNALLSSLPRATVASYGAVHQLGMQTVQSFLDIRMRLHLQAVDCKRLFEELVRKDLAIFEEKRVQDLLLSRAEAPPHAIGDVDFRSLWGPRLSELLDKRRLHLQKMQSIAEKLQSNTAAHVDNERAEICEEEKFTEQLEGAISSQPISFPNLDCVLSQEAGRRSATVQTSRLSLQLLVSEQNNLLDELKQLEVEGESQLREEKSKSATLLRALEGAPLKKEVSLLRDNQQLVLQLQRAEETIKMLHVQKEELEEIRMEANHSVSQHKEATQLLQTELQDSRALVQEKDDTIQTLKNKLRASETNAPPSAAEQERLRHKVFQMELKLNLASDQHKLEIQRMNTVLREKEASLRSLKEALRKLQQQGEEPVLQGKELYARLTNPREVVIESSIALEKTKLEEKVQQLQLKITELESVGLGQKAEISKWKSRAIKLKRKSKAEVDRTPPSSPTKRGYTFSSDSDHHLNSPKNKILVTPKNVLESPQKPLDSPNMSLLDTPKNKFLDMAGGSDLLSSGFPKEFFDNSSLGAFADKDGPKEVSWPWSPKEEEMCKTQ
ncbi:transcript variant X3, partial [Nothobranchius furzeri]